MKSVTRIFINFVLIVLSVVIINPVPILAHKTQYDYPVVSNPQDPPANQNTGTSSNSNSTSTPSGDDDDDSNSGDDDSDDDNSDSNSDDDDSDIEDAQDDADAGADDYVNTVTTVLNDAGVINENNLAALQNLLNALNALADKDKNVLGEPTVEEEAKRLLETFESTLPSSIAQSDDIQAQHAAFLERARALDEVLPTEIGDEESISSYLYVDEETDVFLFGGLAIPKKIIYISMMTLLLLGLAGLAYYFYDKKYSNRKKGFTLVELLVVISIVTILSLIAFVSYTTTLSNIRNSGRKTNLQEAQKTLELFHQQYGEYPSTGGVYYSSEANDLQYEPHPDNYIPGIVPEFISSLPRDPLGGSESSNPACVGEIIAYVYISDGINYKLMSHCGPEGEIAPNDAYRDPNYPSHAWSLCNTVQACETW